MKLFGGPKVSDDQKKRIPPGQYFTEKWPVLHYGSVPSTDLATWNFKVWGEVEQPFSFGAGVLVRLVPDGDPLQLAPVLATVRESVVRVEAFADGRLEIEFGSGALATVDSSEEFEAWNLVGPGGARLVATPGGGVTAWGAEVA